MCPISATAKQSSPHSLAQFSERRPLSLTLRKNWINFLRIPPPISQIIYFNNMIKNNKKP
jgi:hypothetical protein